MTKSCGAQNGFVIIYYSLPKIFLREFRRLCQKVLAHQTEPKFLYFVSPVKRIAAVSRERKREIVFEEWEKEERVSRYDPRAPPNAINRASNIKRWEREKVMGG